MAVSESEGEAAIRALALPTGLLSVVANGVDTGLYIPPPAPKARPPFLILAASRLSEEKAPLGLLHIFSKLIQRYPESSANLLIAGVGPLESVFRSLLGQLQLEDRVRCLGWVDDMPSLFQSAHVYLSASRGEGLSLGMLEAMSAGLPIVATSVQGHVDLISPGVNGFVFEENDLDQAADCLFRLEIDPILAARLGRSSRNQVVASFSLDRNVALLERLYLTYARPFPTSTPCGGT